MAGEKVLLLYHAPTFRVKIGNVGVVCVDMSLNAFPWSGLFFFWHGGETNGYFVILGTLFLVMFLVMSLHCIFTESL